MAAAAGRDGGGGGHRMRADLAHRACRRGLGVSLGFGLELARRGAETGGRARQRRFGVVAEAVAGGLELGEKLIDHLVDVADDLAGCGLAHGGPPRLATSNRTAALPALTWVKASGVQPLDKARHELYRLIHASSRGANPRVGG